MEQFAILLKPVINTLLVIVLIILSFALYYLTITLFKISKITKRIEALTDISTWFDIIKTFNKWRKEKLK
jgi:hypothetical protein